MTDTDPQPPARPPADPPPDAPTADAPTHRERRRRRRRSSPANRFIRFLGIDRSRGRAAFLLIALAILVVAGLIALAGGRPSDGSAASSASASSAPQRTATATLPAVSTLTPVVTPSSKPAGIVATRIRMARLGIDLRIVEGDGIDAPLNKAAHYPGTGWPGGGTNIYLYAHAQTGMFLSLWGAQVGDEVDLTLADGTTRPYLVTQILPKVAWDALGYLSATPTEQLTLQTCTSYTATAPRFIVIAEPAPATTPAPSAVPGS